MTTCGKRSVEFSQAERSMFAEYLMLYKPVPCKYYTAYGLQ